MKHSAIFAAQLLFGVWLMLPGAWAFAQSRNARKANVILVTIDTLRADHVGCYGYAKIQTPTLDGLAHDGILFGRALSQVPLTWPSHTAILTGTYPFQNGVQDFTGQPLDPRFRSVAQAFKANGYATGAVVSAFVLDRSWGLARGFDFYDDAFSPEAFQEKDPGLVDRKAGESVTRALRWLQANQHRPFFFWLHLYDPHSPYDPPEPYRTQYRDHLYDGEIAYADHELGRVMAWLKRTQLYAGSLIVVLSDHGESLGEHGEHEHGFFVYNPTVRVPLIVKAPVGLGVQRKRVVIPVETTAVAPTLLRLAGINNDAIETQFHSPGLLEEKAADNPAYSETFYPFSSFGWSPLHSLETARYHYIDAPQPELYDNSADPGEKNNLASEQPATVAVLKEKLQSLLRMAPYTPSAENAGRLAPDAQEKLRALGYVSYKSPISSSALAAGLSDPKERIGEFNTILAAQDAFHNGDFSTGQELLAKLQQQDADMYIVPFMLAEGAAKKKDWQTSAAQFERCLELNPNFDNAMTGLSRALYSLGDLDGAKRWSEKAVKLNPQNWRALYELGSIESHLDKATAITDFEKAVAIQGDFAPLRRDLGMLYFERQNYSEAARHLVKAADLGLKEAVLFNFLGICYDRLGRLSTAVATYKHALQLDDKLAVAHLNLGFSYHRQGRELLARQEYQRACELNPQFCATGTQLLPVPK